MAFKLALRRLLRAPGFTLVALLTLAVGIGANSALFTLVQEILLQDRPFESADELVEVYLLEGDSHGVLSYPEFEDLRDGTTEVFTKIAGSQLTLAQLTHDDGVDSLPGELVTGHYFDALGLDPALGRLLGPEDDVARRAHSVVVLSYDFWQTRFGGSESVIGDSLRLGATEFTIVGVAPRVFEGNFRGLEPDVYLPIQMIDLLQPNQAGIDSLAQRGDHSLFVRARLAPGVSRVQAETAAAAVAESIRQAHPKQWPREARFALIPTTDVILFPPVDRFLRAAAWLLFTVTALVLLITCANLASLLLARAADQRREIGLHLALGAQRREVVWQLLVESLLLAILGGLAGVGLGALGLRLLLQADLPLPLPLSIDLSLDPGVLLFSLGVTVLAGVFFGLLPALRGTDFDIAESVKPGADEERGRRTGWRHGLVSAQVAVCLVLLVLAGLFLRSLQATLAVDPGFGSEPAAVLDFGLPGELEPIAGAARMEQMLEAFRSIPGVQSVGLMGNLHLNSLSQRTRSVRVDGIDPPPGRDSHSVDWAQVTPDLFDAASLRFLSGRNFRSSDDADSQAVAIVNRAFAERFFPTVDPLGRRVMGSGDQELEIVGVVRTAKVRTLGEAPRPFLYLPYSQSYSPVMTAVARTTVPAGPVALDMLQAARRLEPDLWVSEAKTLQRHVGILLVPARLAATVLSGFAAIALLLCCVGLYGLVSYAVVRRTREVGIRVSLGARPRDVVGLLMGSGARATLRGALIGLVFAAIGSTVLQNLLFGIAALDPWTFILIPLVLLATTGLAVLIPALRALRVPPVQALRSE